MNEFNKLKPGDPFAYKWWDWGCRNMRLCWAIFGRVDERTGNLFPDFCKAVWRDSEKWNNYTMYCGEGINRWCIVDADADQILADFTAWKLMYGE